MSRKKEILLLTAIMLIAGAIRYLQTAHMGSFYWDELFSTIYSRFPWGQSWRYWAWETNPPLHLLLLKFWFYIFPVTEFWARLPSIIIGVISVPAIYILTKDWLGARAGMLAAVLLAISPYHIFISSLARGYALLILLSILAIYFFAKIFFQDNHDRMIYWFGALCHLLLMYTHLTGAMVIISELVILILLRPQLIKRWIVWGAFPLLLWLIWAIPAIVLKFSANTVGRGWFFNIYNTWDVALSAVQPLLIGTTTIPYFALAAENPWEFSIWIACLAGHGLLLVYLTIKSFREQAKNIKQNYFFLSTAILFWLPILIAAALHLWHIKFISVSLPFLLIITVYFIIVYDNLSTRILLIFLVGFNLMGGILAIKTMPINDWNDINQFLSQHTGNHGKQALIYNNFIDRLFMEKYIKTSLPVIPYADPEDENTPFYDLAVHKNYWRFLRSGATLQTWYEKNNLKIYNQILLFSEDTNGVDLAKTLNNNGWILDSRLRSHTGDPRSISLYVRSTTTSTPNK